MYSSLLLWSCLLIGTAAAKWQRPPFKSVRLTDAENFILQQTCGEPPRQNEKKAMHSQIIERSFAPWVVSVVHNGEDWHEQMGEYYSYNRSRSICSGTLISPRHVLLSANCINQNSQNIRRVRFVISPVCGDAVSGLCDGKLPISVHKTKGIFTSALLSQKNQTDKAQAHYLDIAVAELDRPVDVSNMVYPACLADYEVQDEWAQGNTFDIFGYGGVKAGTESLGVLQQITTMQVPCGNATERKKDFNKDKMCTRGYQHPCKGDIGAGLIAKQDYLRGKNVPIKKQGQMRVVAIVSSDDQCVKAAEEQMIGQDNLLDVNTLVAPHLYWICEATGICLDNDVAEEVRRYKAAIGNATLPTARYAIIKEPEADYQYIQ